ncbi:hypothetical protein AVEN_98708-1 [Araneus ventricosus]|uniref:Uncharacterized protein n=1 Tax=Araneus ventricosus TaxID=182803 RepID=A0A4Y2PC99_ARAVE|nr:hypothetical protein AVEN_98708-1 [Araneus ventricosus]
MRAILNRDHITRTTPGLSPSLQASTPHHTSVPVDSGPMGGSVVDTTPAGGCLDTADDLTCDRFHTRRVDSGIGFRTQYPQAPKPLGHRGPKNKQHFQNKGDFMLQMASENIVTLLTLNKF